MHVQLDASQKSTPYLKFSNKKGWLFCNKIKEESIDCNSQNKVKVFCCTCMQFHERDQRNLRVINTDSLSVNNVHVTSALIDHPMIIIWFKDKIAKSKSPLTDFYLMLSLIELLL